MAGYSDRIHHALAFAAKHHDQQVRKGLRAPYFTQPANLAIILTRYGQDDTTVIAGILHQVVDDFSRNGLSREQLEERLGGKFGSGVLDLLITIVARKLDDDGVELSPDERRDDVLARLASAPEGARWVCAADALHSASSLAADLRRTVDADAVWARVAVGREATLRWYRRVLDQLSAAGFAAPVMAELAAAVQELEGL
ncbi:MAG: HD domain-containing protein [Gemmatimonadetes bacterium]|nr:HD domain-containing protein [Gemmatimonadota bacterium]